MSAVRSPLAVTIAVWKALFLREALSSISGRRFGWFWIMAEPLFHISYLVVFHGIIRTRAIGGINPILWILAGVLGFYIFTRPARRAIHAISANKALFVYRQIKAVDTVFARIAVEGLLFIVISLICFAVVGFFGVNIAPDDPLTVLAATFGLLLLALGFGLTTSVANELIPELARFIELPFMTLYILSGTLLPLSAIPEPYRAYFMLNPIAHGLDLIRLGFASHYHALSETSMGYLYVVGLVILFFGLALQVRFSKKLVEQ